MNVLEIPVDGSKVAVCGADAALERHFSYPGATAFSIMHLAKTLHFKFPRFNLLFQFRDFYNKASHRVFILFFFLKHSLCIKHHMHCISKPSSLADFLVVIEFHLLPFF